jgi:hypothetical protein
VKVDEFRKTWIMNFPISETSKIENAINIQDDPLLVIREEAYHYDDTLRINYNSLHYTGKEFLDAFWNTYLELRPIEKKEKKEVKKKRATRKKVAKKRVVKKKVVKSTKKSLVEF